MAKAEEVVNVHDSILYYIVKSCGVPGVDRQFVVWG